MQYMVVTQIFNKDGKPSTSRAIFPAKDQTEAEKLAAQQLQSAMVVRPSDYVTSGKGRVFIYELQAECRLKAQPVELITSPEF